MFSECLLILNTLMLLGIIGSIIFFSIKVSKYFKHIQTLYYTIMDSEELLLLENTIKDEDESPITDPVKLDKRKERLAAIILGGQSTKYLGKNVSPQDLDSMSPQDLDRLYTRYESRLGASMTATLGQSAIQLYTTLVSKFLPIPVDRQPLLASDLQADPFVSHAMTTAACELYYRFGFYMAPLTAAMTTMRYCQFEDLTKYRVYKWTIRIQRRSKHQSKHQSMRQSRCQPRHQSRCQLKK